MQAHHCTLKACGKIWRDAGFDPAAFKLTLYQLRQPRRRRFLTSFQHELPNRTTLPHSHPICSQIQLPDVEETNTIVKLGCRWQCQSSTGVLHSAISRTNKSEGNNYESTNDVLTRQSTLETCELLCRASWICEWMGCEWVNVVQYERQCTLVRKFCAPTD